MLNSYIKTASRHLFRNKTSTILNIAGLAVGIGATVLIFIVIRSERSFDRFHPHADRIFRVVSVPFRPGSPLGPEAGAPIPLAAALRNEVPGFEKVAAIFGRDGQITVPAERDEPKKLFDESGGIYYAEDDFFDIFGFPWLAGDRRSLAAPKAVAITRTTAVRYFGDWKAAIGKTLQFNNKDWFRVTGVIEDPPANTDFPLRLVFSYASLKDVDRTDWQGTYGRGYTFVRVAAGVSVPGLNKALRELIDRHTPAGRERRGLMLQPLAAMHSDGRFGNFSGRTFSPALSRSLSWIAIALLVMACVNFINLATAQSVKRSQETTVRKILGSSRAQLIMQFMGEAGLTMLLAIAAAYCLAKAALPFCNRLLGMQLQIRLDDPGLLVFLAVVSAGATLLAGLYPAVRLAGWGAGRSAAGSGVRASRGTVSSAGGVSLRRILVVLQFCTAQVLTICVLVVSSQMNLFKNASLGFDKTCIVNVPIPVDSVSLQRMGHVRQELLQQPGVGAVCFSTFSPMDNDIWSGQFKFDHAATKTDFQAFFKWADAGFFKTYRPELVAGRAYGPSDTLQAYVVNETLVKRLGFAAAADILGKEINIFDQLRGPVVGVVKDFHTSSMQNPIQPIVMGCWKDNYYMAGIRLRPGNPAVALAAIREIWRQAYPDYVYTYQFLDDKIDAFYKEEAKLSVLYRVFAGLAVFISCLGLYGLVSFMAAQRTREIGLRKVLGASVTDMLVLLSRETTLLIFLAFFLAAPVAWLLMHRWLEGFAYRIRPGAGIFLAAAVCSLVVAWATVGYRAYRAAAANPVAALRNE